MGQQRQGRDLSNPALFLCATLSLLHQCRTLPEANHTLPFEIGRLNSTRSLGSSWPKTFLLLSLLPVAILPEARMVRTIIACNRK